MLRPTTKDINRNALYNYYKAADLNAFPVFVTGLEKTYSLSFGAMDLPQSNNQ